MKNLRAQRAPVAASGPLRDDPFKAYLEAVASKPVLTAVISARAG